ncbi:MAG: hypothetical protein HY905_09860 [Deltaproteobacteria bacterium]|nr:hypothetical protein [Deltaproteobacteria bacterium]
MPTLEEVLIDQGLVRPAQVDDARELDRELRGGIGLNLVRLHHLTEEDLVEAFRRVLPQLGVADLEVAGAASSFALGLVPLTMIERYRAVPLSLRGTELTVAMANPLDADAIAAIERHTRCRVTPLVAAESVVSWALLRFFNVLTPSYAAGGPGAMAAATVSLTDAETDAGIAIPLLRRRRAPVGESPEDLSQVPVDLAPQRRKSQPPPPGEMGKLEAALARMERQGKRTVSAMPEVTKVATPPANPPADPPPDAGAQAASAAPAPKPPLAAPATPPPDAPHPRPVPGARTLPPPPPPPPPKVEIDPRAFRPQEEPPTPPADEAPRVRAGAATRELLAPPPPPAGPLPPATTKPLMFVPPPIIASSAAAAAGEAQPPARPVVAAAPKPAGAAHPTRMPAVAKPISTGQDEGGAPASTRPMPLMPEPRAAERPAAAPATPAAPPAAPTRPSVRPRVTTPRMGVSAPFSPTNPGLPGLVPVTDQAIERLRQRIANLQDRDAVTASALWTVEEVLGPAAFFIRQDNAFRVHRAGKHFRAIFGEGSGELRQGQEPRLEQAFVEAQVQASAAQPFPLRSVGRRTIPPQLVLIPVQILGRPAGVIVVFTEKALEVLRAELKRYDILASAVSERFLAILKKKKGK